MNSTPFQVYNASAGSGKTYTLVQKYLEACFASKTPFQNILAITFTNKAAAEMKNRVIKALKELAAKVDAEKENSLFSYFQEKMNWSEEMLAQKSADLLEEILHDYSSFSISTIDKFTHRIVRSFAMDLHLPLNFEVVMDQDKMIDEIVDSLIAKAGTDKELTKLLLDFMETKADDDASWDPKKPLATMAKRLFEEGSQDALKSLENISIHQWQNYSRAIKTEVDNSFSIPVNAAKHALATVKSSNIEIKNFAGGERGAIGNIEKIAQGDVFHAIKTAKKAFEKDVWYGSKKGVEIENAIKSISPILNQQLQTILEWQNVEGQKARTMLLAQKSLFSVAMLNELSKLLASQKEQGQYLHISDFNKIISDNIQDQPAPFLYERLGEKYQHYFIDEFQDTSLQQWKNLEPLISNALAYENGACMLVGDGKQAIYRFRGGDVEQFLGLADAEKLDPEWIHSLDRKQVTQLPDNYRSRKEVVEFNNQFFAFTAETFEDEAYQGLYKKAGQGVKGETEGYVSVNFLESKRNADEEDPSYQENTLLLVLSQVKMCFDKGYELNDIAILTRGKKEGQKIGEALVKEGYPVTSPDSLKLTVSEDIRFLIAALNTLTDPTQGRHRIHLLEYLLEQKTIDIERNLETEKAWKKGNLKTFSETLKVAGIDWNAEACLHLPVYECLETCIRAFKMEQKANPYIELFLDLVWDYSRHNPAAISSFLEWWNDSKDNFAVSLPDNVDAINVMTIHKSKGLEFPVVIYPFADDNVALKGDGAWVANELEVLDPLPVMYYGLTKQAEEAGGKLQEAYELKMQHTDLDVKNLLYVALTRAVDALFITGKQPPKKNENPTKAVNKLLHAFLEDELTDWHYEQGKLPTKAKSPESTKAQKVLPYLSTSDWRPRLRMALRADNLWGDDAGESSRQFGNQVHDILAQVTTQENLEPVILKNVNQGLLTQAEAKTFLNSLKPIVAHPDLKDFFSDEVIVWSEKSILMPNASVARPDRVVLHKDGAVSLLDFKTGAPKESHEQQLSGYKMLLTEMGYSVKESILVYTETLNIEKL